MILPTHRLVRPPLRLGADGARRAARARCSRSSRCPTRPRPRARSTCVLPGPPAPPAAEARGPRLPRRPAAGGPRARRRAPPRRDPRAAARRRGPTTSTSRTTTPRRSPPSRRGRAAAAFLLNPPSIARGARRLPGRRADAARSRPTSTRSSPAVSCSTWSVRPGCDRRTSRGDAPPDESRPPRRSSASTSPSSTTASSSLVDYMGSDEDVERAARVSYGYGTRRTSQTRGLIRYLRRHRHTTPSRDGGAQVPLRDADLHRAAVDPAPHRERQRVLRALLADAAAVLPARARSSCRRRARRNRQGRARRAARRRCYAEAIARWERAPARGREHYEWLVGHDVARELARIDLPLSPYTQWYWKIDLHNLLHFLSLRVDAHAQYEIRAYARVMAGHAAARGAADLRGVDRLRGRRHAPLARRAGGAAAARARARRRARGAPRVASTAAELEGLGLVRREIDELLREARAAPAARGLHARPARAARPEEYFARAHGGRRSDASIGRDDGAAPLDVPAAVAARCPPLQPRALPRARSRCGRTTWREAAPADRAFLEALVQLAGGLHLRTRRGGTRGAVHLLSQAMVAARGPSAGRARHRRRGAGDRLRCVHRLAEARSTGRTACSTA